MVPVEPDTILERPPGPRTFIRFLGWMIRTDPWRAAVSLALQFTAGLLPAVTLWALREIFDRGVDLYEGRLSVEAMLPWLALWAAVTLAETGIQMWSRTILLERLKQEMEDRLLEQLQVKSGPSAWRSSRGPTSTTSCAAPRRRPHPASSSTSSSRSTPSSRER